MLKPLLLLWCAATIVSAGEPNNDLIPVEPTKLEPTDQKISATTLSIDTNAHSTTESINDSKVPPVIVSTTNSPKTESTKTTPTKSTTTTSTTTTTPKPTTTTPPPTTTTPVPTTPLPPPSTAKWIVSENKTSCIIVQVAAQLNVSYTDKTNKTIHKALDIPVNGTITGKCGVTEQNLTFSWKPQNVTNKNITISNFTLHFVKNDTEKHYSLHHLEISLAEILTESNKSLNLVHMVPQFTTGLSNSYRCVKEQTLNLTLKDNKNVTAAHLKVSDLQFQAFRGDNTTVFGIAQDCSFNTPDIVPITVGCALAGLVVVVLIAYLVGRRRSQARGYLSM